NVARSVGRKRECTGEQDEGDRHARQAARCHCFGQMHTGEETQDDEREEGREITRFDIDEQVETTGDERRETNDPERCYVADEHAPASAKIEKHGEAEQPDEKEEACGDKAR